MRAYSAAGADGEPARGGVGVGVRREIFAARALAPRRKIAPLWDQRESHPNTSTYSIQPHAMQRWCMVLCMVHGAVQLDALKEKEMRVNGCSVVVNEMV